MNDPRETNWQLQMMLIERPFPIFGIEVDQAADLSEYRKRHAKDRFNFQGRQAISGRKGTSA
jgi:hypothetical protein